MDSDPAAPRRTANKRLIGKARKRYSVAQGPVSPGQGSGTTPRDDSGPGGDDPGGDDPNTGNQGGDDGGSAKGDDDDCSNSSVCCHCCGKPWWCCHWCHYWTPMYWCYCGYYPGYWYDCWYPKKWGTVFVEYHSYYDYETSYPNIYTPPAQTLEPDSASIEFLDVGAELFRAGKYLDALHQFHLAALADPDFGVPRFAYALALFSLGIFDYAAYELRMALELLPEWIEIGGDIKLMYGDEADFDQQLAALINHLKIWPDDEEAVLVLGYVSFFSGDLYLAEKAFLRLHASVVHGTRDLAIPFLEAIDKIKEMIAATEPDSDVLVEDNLTLTDLLRN